MVILNVGNMKIENKKSIYDDLKNYDYLAKDNDFIEITEWTNGEGYDISIERNNSSKLFNLTIGELDAINYLIKTLDFKDNNDN